MNILYQREKSIGLGKIDDAHDIIMPEALENPGKIGNISRPPNVLCRQSCHVQKNQIQMSFAPYPHRGNFFQQKEFCHVASHLWQISCQNQNRRFFLDESYPNLCNVLEDYQNFFNTNASCKTWPESFYETGQNPKKELKNELYEYGRENLALVHVLIQSPFLTKIKRDVAISFTSYVANTGGLLGLCLGFSFISGIEILFWCFICIKKFFS